MELIRVKINVIFTTKYCVFNPSFISIDFSFSLNLIFIVLFFKCLPTCSCMESCVFGGEDFPKENRKPANGQQTLCQLKLAIFYTRCCTPFFIHLFLFYCFQISKLL